MHYSDCYIYRSIRKLSSLMVTTFTSHYTL
uniref:Uncharacterized protein n=1 Tax=Anguilla anguilla TaxID=7936 RepID=A0A0E9UAS9_ANGAN